MSIMSPEKCKKIKNLIWSFSTHIHFYMWLNHYLCGLFQIFYKDWIFSFIDNEWKIWIIEESCHSPLTLYDKLFCHLQIIRMSKQHFTSTQPRKMMQSHFTTNCLLSVFSYARIFDKASIPLLPEFQLEQKWGRQF